MYNQEDLKALELFNRKAEILKNSSFMKFLVERGTGITISGGKGKATRAETKWPNDEARDAFILTFRFFIQKKEKSSFKKMAKVYENLPISQEKKESFKDARNKFNDYLDSKSPITFRGQGITYREIIKVFLYGEFAHANEKKKEIFDQWMSYPLMNVLIYNEFIYILGNVMYIIACVQDLNEEVIKELSEKR